MDFILSINNREISVLFPVIPNEGITLERSQKNDHFESVNGEIQSIGKNQLAHFEISSIFPCRPYSWIRPGATADGWEYVRMINTQRQRGLPFRAILLDNDGQEIFNLPVTIDSFSYERDQAGDIEYTIDFTEFRFAPLPEAKLGKPKSAKGKKTEKAETVRQVEQQTVTPSPGGAPSGSEGTKIFKKMYTQNDAIMMAKVFYLESRGIVSMTEIACVGWTILNRVDSGMGSIYKVITAPAQFAYRGSAKTVSDHGYDLVALATDVLNRWSREKAGQTNVGRVLPREYKWYAGDGKHNKFRNKYKGNFRYWNFSWPSPYRN